MNKTEQTVIVGAGIVALAVVLGSVIIAERLSKALDDKNFWAGREIPGLIGDVRNITTPISTAVTGWTRA